MIKTSKKVAYMIDDEIRYIDIENMEINQCKLKEYIEIATRKRYKTYIHKLHVNGWYISKYLLLNKFKFVDIPKNLKEWTKTEGDDSSIYNIKIKLTAKDRAIEFVDSKKILNFSESELLTGFLFEQEIEDLSIDDKLKIVSKSLKMMFDDGYTHDTMSSNAWNKWKNDKFQKDGKFSESKMRNVIPKLTLEEDNFVRESYRGGWCYLTNDSKKWKNQRGICLDVNSLFPSVMYNMPMPWGYPIKFEGKYEEDKYYPLWIARIHFDWISLKKNKFPFIPKNIEFEFENSGYCEEYENFSITLTKPDFELLLENYDVGNYEFIKGYKFRSISNLFKEYIDFFMEIKQNDLYKNTAKRQIAKLFLNSLYGKFASKVYRNKFSYELKNGKEIKHIVNVSENNTMYYTAISAFISSYARCITIRAANSNYKYFIYSDTDSIHLNCDESKVKNIKIDSRELGAWKIEKKFSNSKYLGSKTYAECDKNGWEFKVAGLPKEAMKNLKIENFEIGRKVSCKVLIRTSSGVEYQDREFTISECEIGKVKQ